MYKVVLLRHGQSTWNQENRFTGWKDVDLADQGRGEALEVPLLLLEMLGLQEQTVRPDDTVMRRHSHQTRQPARSRNQRYRQQKTAGHHHG